MKKLVLPVIILALLVWAGMWYAKKEKVVTPPTTTTTYSSPGLGISFTYPKSLSASTTANTVRLHHEVPFEHHDYCDFKGEGTTTVPTLTDFEVKMSVSYKNLVDTMKTESPYIPAENFVNGTVVESPGFIDSVTFGSSKEKGYKIFEGAEGCGFTVYYLPLGSNKTLVLKDTFVTVFSGAIDVNEEVRAMETEGVISKRNHDEILNSILQSVKAN